MSQSQENAANIDHWASQFKSRLLRELEEYPKAFIDASFHVTILNGRATLEASTITHKHKAAGAR